MLKILFDPQGVAILGLTTDPGQTGGQILDNLLRGGFGRKIYPVHPRLPAIRGMPCCPSLDGVEGIDLAIVVSPQAEAEAAVRQAIRAQVKGIVLISAGFREAGPEGSAVQERVAQLCREAGTLLLGPNCLGLINRLRLFNATTHDGPLPPIGGVSIISQSGAVCSALLGWMVHMKIGLAKLAGIGNKADLNEVSFLAWLARDPETKVIVCFLETISDGPSFLKAAEEAAATKPVIVMKVGITPAGRRAALLHTGGFPGVDLAYGAAFRRVGAIRVHTLEQLQDFTMALARQPLPCGGRVGVISNAGGLAVMAADTLDAVNLTVAEPTPATLASLAKVLPWPPQPGVPLDLGAQATPDLYAIALETLLTDPQVDAVVVVVAPLPAAPLEEIVLRLHADPHERKPVLVALVGAPPSPDGHLPLLTGGNLPLYTSPSRAIVALAAMHHRHTWQQRPPRVVTHFPVNQTRVKRIINSHRRTHQVQIQGIRAREILSAYGFLVPHAQTVDDVDAAMEWAERIGYPVTLSVAASEAPVLATTDLFREGLRNPEEVRDTYDLLTLRLQRQLPASSLPGITVERTLPAGRRVVIGMLRDPLFGPMLTFGAGCTSVEVMQDVSFHLAPITADEAMQMLRSTRSFSQLGSERGLNDIAESLQRLSQLATDFPAIQELEINPLITDLPGTPPLVGQVRINLIPHEGPT
ncbi:MAG: acetate--CoA ligase family protein [Magnetococcales bacterium]|nr:acetate--CoA ligase family protein [Magnetococcales bacterium]